MRQRIAKRGLKAVMRVGDKGATFFREAVSGGVDVLWTKYQTHLELFPALLFTSPGTTGKSLNLSRPQFPHLK